MSKSIFVDSARCIGCHSCQIACVGSHRSFNNVQGTIDSSSPRLYMSRQRTGIAFSHCHHCLNAPCLASCPIQAISSANDVILVDAARCDGCGKCAPACPFDAMSMVPAPAPLQQADVPERQVAQKCDLCNTKAEGPACVQACPLKIIYLIDFDKFDGLSPQWAKISRQATVPPTRLI